MVAGGGGDGGSDTGGGGSSAQASAGGGGTGTQAQVSTGGGGQGASGATPSQGDTGGSGPPAQGGATTDSTGGGSSSTGDNSKDAAKKPPSSESAGIELPDRLGVFLSPIGDFGDKNPEFHHAGYDFSTVGFSLGADYRLNDWAVAGLGGGFSKDDDSIGTDGSRSQGSSFNITAYGTIQATDQIYIDGILTWATMNFDSKRLATPTGLFAYGNRDGEQLYGALSSGYEFDIDALTLAPYIRINLASAVLDRFAEHGAGSASLTVGQEDLTDLSTVIGFRGDYAISLEDGILSPHFRVELNHEFEGASHTTLDYADELQGPFFKFASDPVDRNNMTIGVGASYLTENALSITFDYEALLAYRNEQSHSFTIGVTRRF
jgi:outer membrane autotransporter protein